MILKRLTIAFGIAALLASVVACTDYTQSEPEMNDTSRFDGTILDYLSSRQDGDVTFDSLLFIIDNIPGLRDELSQPGMRFTLFAPTDKSIASAFNALNKYRKSNDIGDPVYLSDLLVDSFEIEDTVITVQSLSTGNDVRDTTYVYRTFDYRLRLDSLVAKYSFPEVITTDEVLEMGGSMRVNDMRYSSEMMIKAGRYDAGGIVDTGVKYLHFVEMNGSSLQSNWITTEISERDIEVDNGIVHIITNNHEFGFNSFTKLFMRRGTETSSKTIVTL